MPVAPSQDLVSDASVKIGDPFTVGGKTYKPEDVANYDDVGYASWYGEELEGRATANGETFVSVGVSAAHKTLPMPSYVEVTALDTGKTIVVRVNDRGPFANDRIIDLSAGAARELGIMGQGVAGVRVRKVNPPEQDKSVLRSGRAAPARVDTPESLLKVLRSKLAQLPRPAAPVQQAASASPVRTASASPVGAPAPTPTPTPTRGDGRFVREGSGATGPAPVQESPVRAATPAPAPTPANGNGRFVRQTAGAPAAAQQQSGTVYVVQIAAYGSRVRAEEFARRAGATVQQSSDGRLFRVRYGPYPNLQQAEQALAAALSRGYSGSRVFEE